MYDGPSIDAVAGPWTLERAAQVPNIHLGDDVAAYAGDLVSCTNDPEVFALHQEMCEAIGLGTWRAGPRPATLSGDRHRSQQQRRDAGEGYGGRAPRHDVVKP